MYGPAVRKRVIPFISPCCATLAPRPHLRFVGNPFGLYLLQFFFVTASGTLRNTPDNICENLQSSMDGTEIAKYCIGQKKLGKSSIGFFFDARTISEDLFNDLFESVLEVNMCLDVQNTLFTRLRFPNLLRWNACHAGAALTVIGNPELVSIEFNPNVKFYQNEHVNNPPVAIIRGNRKLERRSIEELMRIFKTFRFLEPIEGECSTPGRIEDLAQLNCEAYYGDIVLSYNAEGEIPPVAGDVDGCLIVTDTLLTDIEFLRGFRFTPDRYCQNVIARNPFLCISEKLEQHLRSQMNISITDNMDIFCRKYVEKHVMVFALVGGFFAAVSIFTVFLKLYLL
ncbi:hypothetical protein RB195_020524 [Necator americanus]|uniref:Receptor L-domain domain-containing protein n=1 Tax=Necator americanus TaxID=51031 RepID=A0ABR1CJ93_NECAM